MYASTKNINKILLGRVDLEILKYFVEEHNVKLNFNENEIGRILQYFHTYADFRGIHEIFKYFVENLDFDIHIENNKYFYEYCYYGYFKFVQWIINASEPCYFKKYQEIIKNVKKERTKEYFNHYYISLSNIHKLLEAKLRCIKYEIHNSLVTNKKLPQEIVETHLIPFLYNPSFDLN